MASKILLKLIDEAILPAVLVIGGKVISLAALVWFLGLSWQFSTTTLIPTVSFDNPVDLLLVNSYSNLVMFVVIAAGLFWVLFRAHVLHDTHISPSLTLKLLTWDLTAFLTSSFDVFHQAVVWFAFLWLVLLSLGLHVVLGITYFWVFVIALVFSLLLTWLLIEDIERELAL